MACLVASQLGAGLALLWPRRHRATPWVLLGLLLAGVWQVCAEAG